eukprot:1850333-Pleurochrysis_carterae.AAC.2
MSGRRRRFWRLGENEVGWDGGEARHGTSLGDSRESGVRWRASVYGRARESQPARVCLSEYGTLTNWTRGEFRRSCMTSSFTLSRAPRRKLPQRRE